MGLSTASRLSRFNHDSYKYTCDDIIYLFLNHNGNGAGLRLTNGNPPDYFVELFATILRARKMAVQLLHKVVEELVLDIVCQNGWIKLGTLGLELKGVLGYSPKTFLNFELRFKGDARRPRHNLPRSLLSFVRNLPFLSVSKEIVKLTANSDFSAWQSIEDLGVAKIRRALLLKTCHLLLEWSPGVIDPNQKGPHGNTLLHLVAALPSNSTFYDLYNEQYLTMLLESGADPRKKNFDNSTPLHIIAVRQNLINQEEISPKAWSSNSRYKQLKAITNEEKYSKAEFADCKDERGFNGNNILHEWVIASLSNDAIHDEFWLGAFIFSFEGLSDGINDMGCTPLHYAYDAELFKFFSLNGGIHESRNDNGDTPLLSVVKKGIIHGENREKLLQGSTRPHGDGRSINIVKIISMVASRNHNILARDRNGNHVIDLLLQSAAQIRYRPSQFLSLCKVLTSLIQYSSSEALNGENKARSTPLEALFRCITIMCNSDLYEGYENALPLLNVMNMLLEKGADPNVIRGPNRDTLLHKCCCLTSLPPSITRKLIGILRTHGADRRLLNNQGKTPLHLLLQLPSASWTLDLTETLLNTQPKTTVRIQMKTTVHTKVLQKLCISSPRKVESYRYDPAVSIGEGAMGMVFPAIDEEGKRGVALKRIQKDHKEKGVSREIEALCKLTQYEQVVDYYTIINSDPDFHFIVLELMEGDLADLIQHKTKELSGNSLMAKLVGDMVKGLKYLHEQRILHRDLKPGNVLYTDIPHLCLKIADFNLAKDLTGYSSRNSTSGHSLSGTRGWMAPELVSRTQTKHTMESDVFSLGLVCHFLMSRGKHAFDPKRAVLTKEAASAQRVLPHELEQSIISGTHHMDKNELKPAGHHLLKQLLSKEIQDRPKLDLIGEHCFFWSIHKKIQFLMAAGDQVEFAKPSVHGWDRVILRLEATPLGRRLRDIPWDTVIPDLYNEMMSAWRHRTYTTTSAAELVRFFRNAYAHEEEQPSARKAELMSNIFFQKFPDLLLTVWGTVLQAGWDKPQPNRERQRVQRALSME